MNKAAIYLITPPNSVKLLKKCASVAEAIKEMRTTPCPYGASMIIIDANFNIITGGYLLEVSHQDAEVTTEYCESKGLAEFTAKVLKGMGYDVKIS